MDLVSVLMWLFGALVCCEALKNMGMRRGLVFIGFVGFCVVVDRVFSWIWERRQSPEEPTNAGFHKNKK
jgi:hypothetical protein